MFRQLEVLDEETSTFTQISKEALQNLWQPHSESSDNTLPPLHDLVSGVVDGESVKLTVYVDMHRCLSEPRWVKSGQVNDWIRKGAKAGVKKSESMLTEDWTSKIDVMDPEAVSTFVWKMLQGIPALIS